MRKYLAALLIAVAPVACAPATPAPVKTVTPPPPALTDSRSIAPSADGQVMVNGLMTCQSTAGVLRNCALDSGATLDDLANSLLWETDLTELQ